MEENKLKQHIIEQFKNLMPIYLKGHAFTDSKLTDTPVDGNQVVPRKYVTLNGVSASRPTSSIIGQFYFDTTLGYPVWWDGTKFVDATGTVA